jgi:hypothetical protein
MGRGGTGNLALGMGAWANGRDEKLRRQQGIDGAASGMQSGVGW